MAQFTIGTIYAAPLFATKQFSICLRNNHHRRHTFILIFTLKVILLLLFLQNFLHQSNLFDDQSSSLNLFGWWKSNSLKDNVLEVSWNVWIFRFWDHCLNAILGIHTSKKQKSLHSLLFRLKKLRESAQILTTWFCNNSALITKIQRMFCQKGIAVENVLCLKCFNLRFKQWLWHY